MNAVVGIRLGLFMVARILSARQLIRLLVEIPAYCKTPTVSLSVLFIWKQFSSTSGAFEVAAVIVGVVGACTVAAVATGAAGVIAGIFQCGLSQDMILYEGG